MWGKSVRKFIVVQKRPYGATQISIASNLSEGGRRVQKRQQLGVLDVSGRLRLKQGHRINAEEKRLLKSKGIVLSESSSPGPGRPVGSGSKVKAAVVAAGAVEPLPAHGWEIKEVGRTAVFEKLAAEAGLTKCLDAAFGEEMAGVILARSMFQVCEGTAAYLASEWQEEVLLSRDPGMLDSGAISRLENTIGETDSGRHAFFISWIEQLGKPDSLILDTTSHSTEAHQILDADWGHNRDGERLPQVNLSMVLDRDQRLPIFFRTLSGSVPDVVSLGTTSQLLRELGLKEFSFVLDRGFHSHDNIVDLLLAKEGFTIGVPLTSKQAKEFVTRIRPRLEDSRNSFLDGDRVVYGVKETWIVEDKRLDGGCRELLAWLFFDPERAHQQRLVLESKMIEFEAIASRRVFTSQAAAQKWIAEHAKGWTEYLTIVQSPDAPPPQKSRLKANPALQRFRVERQHDAIVAARPSLGLTLVLATIAHPSCLAALLTYRCRDQIEKMFRCDKSFLGNLRMRVHSDPTMQGRLFCNFIALILATLFENRLRDTGRLGKISLAEALLRLQKIRRLVIPGRQGVDLEVPKKSADILTACGIDAAPRAGK